MGSNRDRSRQGDDSLPVVMIIFLHVHARSSFRDHARFFPLGPACPNVFPFPIVSSSFSRLHAVSVRIQPTGDDGNSAATLSVLREFSQAPRNSTVRYIPLICTTALQKDAT